MSKFCDTMPMPVSFSFWSTSVCRPLGVEWTTWRAERWEPLLVKAACEAADALPTESASAAALAKSIVFVMESLPVWIPSLATFTSYGLFPGQAKLNTTWDNKSTSALTSFARLGATLCCRPSACCGRSHGASKHVARPKMLRPRSSAQLLRNRRILGKNRTETTNQRAKPRLEIAPVFDSVLRNGFANLL